MQRLGQSHFRNSTPFDLDGRFLQKSLVFLQITFLQSNVFAYLSSNLTRLLLFTLEINSTYPVCCSSSCCTLPYCSLDANSATFASLSSVTWNVFYSKQVLKRAWPSVSCCSRDFQLLESSQGPYCSLLSRFEPQPVYCTI